MAFDCVLIGNESLLVQCAELALDRGHRIVAVVTRNPQVAHWAQGRGLRTERPGTDLAARLDIGFDWLLSIANLSIVPADVLALARSGAVNFHDGPLPRHAGLNAPVWALIEGETQHGITWHLMTDGVDMGDILVTRAFDITAQDTAATTPSPPRTWPMKALTKRSKDAAMPLSDMIVPASTKSGIARSTGLPNCWNPQSIMPFMVTSPMKYITMSAAPKQ